MLSFKKIIYASLFFISACGFTPLQTNSNSSNLTEQVSINQPNTQNEFIFYSKLIDRFGDDGGKYILDYSISTSKVDRAINFDGTVHRIEIFGSVTFKLKDKENGTEISSDREEMYLSYSNSGSTAAVLNAERTTNKQLIVLLANKVADRVSLVIIEKAS
jgi:hypothetical protein